MGGFSVVMFINDKTRQVAIHSGTLRSLDVSGTSEKMSEAGFTKHHHAIDVSRDSAEQYSEELYRIYRGLGYKRVSIFLEVQ